jgi:hypothetical protein
MLCDMRNTELNFTTPMFSLLACLILCQGGPMMHICFARCKCTVPASAAHLDSFTCNAASRQERLQDASFGSTVFACTRRRCWRRHPLGVSSQSRLSALRTGHIRKAMETQQVSGPGKKAARWLGFTRLNRTVMQAHIWKTCTYCLVCLPSVCHVPIWC